MRRPFLACLLFLAVSAPVPALAAALVNVVDITGIISPATADMWREAIERSEAAGAHALVVRLDTPGGLDTSMRHIIKATLASRIPVIVYVAPEGARAASAGVFISYAAHVSAMAPGTNLGAAHPVAMGGGEQDETLMDKATNDAVAYIRSLAELRGRNADWAEEAVRKSVSITSSQALELGVVDLVATDMNDLLAKLDGREVQAAGEPVILTTADADVVELDVSWSSRLLAMLTDPNVAYVLMMLGVYGLIYEFSNPGLILPGIIGAICLILAFYAFSVLPVSYAGLALILLSVVLFIAEFLVAGFGMLAAGGLVALVLGSIMLGRTDAPFAAISWGVLVPVTVITVGFVVLAVVMGVRTFRKRPVSGEEGMLDMVVQLEQPLTPEGRIFVSGEWWSARSEVPVPAGSRVRVKGFEGLTLLVAPEEQTEQAGSPDRAQKESADA